MSKNSKNFLISTADFALFRKDILVCTGTTNLNSSIEVSMQESNVNAGKGSKLIYSYKYGRELGVTLEAADWKLEYIAVQAGSKITEGLTDVYELARCIQVTNGIGILPSVPIGNVAVELNSGLIVIVTPENTTIDLSKYNVENGTVKVTYKYNNTAKSITVSADTSVDIYKLVLDADKHNNGLGKIGHLQIIIPSYQPSGNFTMNFTPDGVSSTNIDGKALAVEGDTCADGSSVYAYIKDFDNTADVVNVSEIAATPANISLSVTGSNKTETISVIGLKGELYSPIQLNNTDCTFVSDKPDIAVVDTNGTVTAVAAGSAKITIGYNGITDEIDVTVE